MLTKGKIWYTKAKALLEYSILDSFTPKAGYVPKRTLLIVRLDAIGDYVLFRNYLEIIRSSKRFRGYQIRYCGNEVVRDLAERYDRQFVDDFIWVNRSLFLANRSYRSGILTTIAGRGYEVVINPTYSRESLFADSIVRVACAKEKVGFVGDPAFQRFIERKFYDRFYNTLISIDDDIVFEYSRTAEFFKHVLQEPVLAQRPTLHQIQDESTATLVTGGDVVICVGGMHPLRRWNVARFLSVADHLLEMKGWRSILVGGSADELSGSELNEVRRRSHVLDVIGKTSLAQTVGLVRHSKLLISNDTSVAHIGVATSVPVVVVSNGNHFGRFTEYPKEVYRNIVFVYPPRLYDSRESFLELANRFKRESRLDINEIRMEDVINAINRVI